MLSYSAVGPGGSLPKACRLQRRGADRGHKTTGGIRLCWEALKYLLANPFLQASWCSTARNARDSTRRSCPAICRDASRRTAPGASAEEAQLAGEDCSRAGSRAPAAGARCIRSARRTAEHRRGNAGSPPQSSDHAAYRRSPGIGCTLTPAAVRNWRIWEACSRMVGAEDVVRRSPIEERWLQALNQHKLPLGRAVQPAVQPAVRTHLQARIPTEATVGTEYRCFCAAGADAHRAGPS